MGFVFLFIAVGGQNQKSRVVNAVAIAAMCAMQIAMVGVWFNGLWGISGFYFFFLIVYLTSIYIGRW
jgi:hypothetical protein